MAKMLAVGLDPNEAHCKSGETPLHAASSMQHLDVMARLIEANANINARLGGDTGGPTPLYLAAQQNQAQSVEKLLKVGCVASRGTEVPALSRRCAAASVRLLTSVAVRET